MKVFLSIFAILLASCSFGAVCGYVAAISIEEVPQVLRSHSTGQIKEIRYPDGTIASGAKATEINLPEKYDLVWVR